MRITITKKVAEFSEKRYTLGSENVAEAGKQQQKDTQRITGGFANGRGNELWRSGNISGKNPDFIQKL